MPKPSEKLLQLLVCPVDKGVLDYDGKYQALSCRSCKRCYQIRDGIPMMLLGSGPALVEDSKKELE